MAQTYFTDCYNKSRNVGTDMDRVETNFSTLKSLFSGTGGPSNPVSGMPWFDTTNKILKVRNQANSAWLGVLYGTASLKTWLYLNSAQDGWVVDSSVTDRVISLKGGTAAYNVAGANTAGDWTGVYSNHTHSHSHTVASHTHQWYNRTAQGVSDQLYDSAGNARTMTAADYVSPNDDGWYLGTYYAMTAGKASTYDSTPSRVWIRAYAPRDSYTSNSTPGTNANAVAGSETGTWRTAAAVGTLQYPNV